MTSGRADVNIEFGHIEIDNGKYSKPELEKSVNVAIELLEKHKGNGLTCSVSMLVDDKKQSNPPDLSRVTSLIELISSRIVVDYICFESRLVAYLDELYDSIKVEHVAKVRQSIESYLERNGRIACSHDIAIWHLLRLGKIRFRPEHILRTNEHIDRQVAPFVARQVISVLPRHYESQEAKAIDEVLKFCSSTDTHSLIKNHYYA